MNSHVQLCDWMSTTTWQLLPGLHVSCVKVWQINHRDTRNAKWCDTRFLSGGVSFALMKCACEVCVSVFVGGLGGRCLPSEWVSVCCDSGSLMENIYMDVGYCDPLRPVHTQRRPLFSHQGEIQRDCVAVTSFRWLQEMIQCRIVQTTEVQRLVGVRGEPGSHVTFSQKIGACVPSHPIWRAIINSWTLSTVCTCVWPKVA